MTSRTSERDHSNPATGPSLPASHFFEHWVFDAEKQGIFIRCWHIVGDVNEFHQRGNDACQDIFDQSVIVVADQQGQSHALQNAVRHRGKRLTGASFPHAVL